VAKHNYENLNEADFKLPANYIELKVDGWKQWYWVLMSNDWELAKGTKKYPNRQECELALKSIRSLMQQAGFCPTIYMEDFKKESNDDNSL